MNDQVYNENLFLLIKYYLYLNNETVDMDKMNIINIHGTISINYWNYAIPQPSEETLRSYDLTVVNSLIQTESNCIHLHASKICSLSQTAINAITPTSGMIVLNTTTDKIMIYLNEWKNIVFE